MKHLFLLLGVGLAATATAGDANCTPLGKPSSSGLSST